MDKKYVLLTGANGGIGKSILEELIKNNFEVISLDLSNSNISELNTKFIKCDVTKKEDLANSLSALSSITSSLFAIVNAIGIFKMQSIIEGSEDDFKKIFDVNFFGIYSINKIMFQLLQKGSKIINITSEVARHTSQPFEGYYTLSKTALDNYTNVLRRECNYLGIKVIKVQSGSMNTKLLLSANDEYQEMANNSKHFKEPLTKLKYMMDRELKKTNDPSIVAKKIVKILNKKHTKVSYKIKNSFALSLLGALPERLQDYIYTRVIK